MKISEGLKEDGVFVGNTYDKYNSSNFIVKRLMAGFESCLSDLVKIASPNSIHEIGCGEGYWVARWNKEGFDARGSDFSETVIKIAQSNAESEGLNSEKFRSLSIYELDPESDKADLFVCCEVLEHLEHPRKALEVLQKVNPGNLILSVPREPIWRILNFARGKYLSQLGNTPGHIQHWSSKAFFKLVGEYFEVVEVKKPFPWTMLLCRPLSQR